MVPEADFKHGTKSDTLVSVVVPAYQAHETIESCVNSILLQTFLNFECIVVIDGATDDTEGIVDELASKDSRVKVVKQRNLGRSAARNNGIHHAQGNWIMFVDADDCLDSGAIEKLVSGITVETDIIYGNYRTSSGSSPHCSGISGEFDLSLLKKACLNIEQLNLQQYDCNYTFDTYNCRTCWAKLYSRFILNKIESPFPEDVQIGEDTLMNYRVLGISKHVAYVDSPIYVYNNNSAGTVRTWSAKNYTSIVNLSNHIQAACMHDSEYRIDLMSFVARDYLGIFSRSSRYAKISQGHEICLLAKNACTDFIRGSLPVYIGNRLNLRGLYNYTRICFVRHNWFYGAFFLQKIAGFLIR